MPLQSVSNKVDGVAGWDKSVVDINNIDESFANARDLGYSRLLCAVLWSLVCQSLEILSD